MLQTVGDGSGQLQGHVLGNLLFFAMLLSGTSAGADEAIRRLPPSAFPQLPSSVRHVLEQRNCLVAQAWQGRGAKPHNVIRGTFLAKKRRAWAVLCSVNGRSSILVIQEGDSHPRAELAPFDDEHFLQTVEPDRRAFSRLINAVSATRIRQNEKMHATPDHDGINDAFMEKASTLRYFHRDTWLELPGTD